MQGPASTQAPRAAQDRVFQSLAHDCFLVVLSSFAWRFPWSQSPICPARVVLGGWASREPLPLTMLAHLLSCCPASGWLSENFLIFLLPRSRHSHHHRRACSHVDRRTLLSPGCQADGQQLDTYEDGCVEAWPFPALVGQLSEGTLGLLSTPDVNPF